MHSKTLHPGPIATPAMAAAGTPYRRAARLPLLFLATIASVGPQACAWAQTAQDQAIAPAEPGAGYEDYSARRHNTLVLTWRAMPDTANHALRQLDLWSRTPLSAADQARVISDLVTIASRSGHPALAVEAAQRVPLDALADYALDPLVGAARARGDRALQGAAVARWKRTEPRALAPRIAEAVWQIDTGDTDTAQRSLDALEAGSGAMAGSTPTEVRVAVLEARAALAEARQDTVGALAAYDRILALDADNRAAQRARIRQLDTAGSPAEAWRQAEALLATRPDAFSPLERATLRQRALGQRVGWAMAARNDLEAGVPASTRLVPLGALVDELALARREAAQAAAQSPTPQDWAPVRSRLQADAMVALEALGRPADALALADEARTEGLTLPWYATAAAASSWQQLRRADLALPLYQQAIADAGRDLPMPGSPHAGLLYTYLDTGRYEEAEVLMAQLEAATPPTLRLAPTAGRPNADYTDVRLLRASMLLYTDQPAEAEEALRVLGETAPANVDVRIATARTQRMRGRPEAAAEQLRGVLAEYPDSVGAQVAYAEALIDIGDYTMARTLGDTLRADYPDSASARNMLRSAAATTGARLDVEAIGAKGGQVLANREARLDMRLSSALRDDRWRLFYDQSLGGAKLDNGTTRRARGGVGLQWQEGRWDAEAQLHQSNGGPARTGAAAAVNYRASDAWRFLGRIDSNTVDVPWRAWQAGISASEAAAGVRYVPQESRRIEAQVQWLHFRDGNDRRGASTGWTERWFSGPRLQFETAVAAGASRASTNAVPYFSPRRDATVEGAARLQWLTWKRDDRTFLQLFEVGAGRYNQAGFGTGPIWQAKYGHRWTAGPAFRLEYGIAVSRHPYDGVRETRRQIFVTASIPLP